MSDAPYFEVDNPNEHSITVNVNGEPFVIGAGCSSSLNVYPKGSLKGEPVAWRYRYREGGSWKYVDLEDHCNPLATYQKEPLYAAPSPSAESLLREAHQFLNAQAYVQEDMDEFCKRLDAHFGIPSDQ